MLFCNLNILAILPECGIGQTKDPQKKVREKKVTIAAAVLCEKSGQSNTKQSFGLKIENNPVLVPFFGQITGQPDHSLL